MIREWFDEYVSSGKGKPHRIDDDSDFIVYKGFKILRDGEQYTIEDGRFSDMYSKVSEYDMARLVRHGFMMGCDMVKYQRDTARLDKHVLNLLELDEERLSLLNSGLDHSSREYKKRYNKIRAASEYHSVKRSYYVNKMKVIEERYNLESYEGSN